MAPWIAQVYTYRYWLGYFWYRAIPTCSICQHQQVVNAMSCTRRCLELAGITMCFTHDKDIIACQQNARDRKDLKAIKRQSASKPHVSDPVFLRSSSDLHILLWHHHHWWAVGGYQSNWTSVEGNARHFVILRINANPTFPSKMCTPLQFCSITQASPIIIIIIVITFATRI